MKRRKHVARWYLRQQESQPMVRQMQPNSTTHRRVAEQKHKLEGHEPDPQVVRSAKSVVEHLVSVRVKITDLIACASQYVTGLTQLVSPHQ